ncbi:hypothetical protein SAMN04487975_10815 [Planococcus glaciei]|uniref:hypothetical protein n=1 Tax=Planococcus glaciei TaxID=459472 RepID=UPI00088C0094|nr:hypothetical protein [Planococcus glaciei]SDH78968.1 hypothetical protein SAMN04487975_10815 [Planococcus glaciei]
METVSTDARSEAIKSFQSTIRKCENAVAQMTQKGSNTALLKKRLNALEIGLAILENAWYQKRHPYTSGNLAEARQVLNGLLPSIEQSCAKSKPGSPQHTLLERRLKSLDLAIQALDDFLSDK